MLDKKVEAPHLYVGHHTCQLHKLLRCVNGSSETLY